MTSPDRPTASAFRAWRNRLNFDRAAAAAALGLAVATVKTYELGQRPVSRTVARLMRQVEASHVQSIHSVPGAPIRIIGGGTVSHVRNHLALCAPAYGTTARRLLGLCHAQGRPAELVLTRMADPASAYETAEDLGVLAEQIVADPAARIVFWNPAICDYNGTIGSIASGPKSQRMKTSAGAQVIDILPADKLVSRFRRTRKDLFLVAFKTTTGATADEQYRAGLALLKDNSVNLVLANDTVTGLNMVVAPEETRYHQTFDREEALAGLVDMALLRASNTFTRSEVVPGPGVAWSDPEIPANLRAVVEHCIARGAYKPFQGKTVGHFAVRGADGTIITSRRKSNFNQLPETGMVRIRPVGNDRVLAEGGKPSVGGMSQKIIFDEHPSAHNIVHFHCPPRSELAARLSTRDQRPNECGSHQCGQNTSAGLVEMEEGISAVMLDNHGPNIVYGREVPAQRVIDFIERHFDLTAKTGGLVA
jgi:hypothetical protein